MDSQIAAMCKFKKNVILLKYIPFRDNVPNRFSHQGYLLFKKEWLWL